MNTNYLNLPEHEEKPRGSGLTMVIDRGTPLTYFSDLIRSNGQYIDFIKFGWGTSVVANDLKQKIEVLRSEGVDFYFGGTLFEKYLLQEKFNEFRVMCESYGCQFIEVSNGTVELNDADKVSYIEVLSRDFSVISEVGSKDQARSEMMAPKQWIDYIRNDLEAGAVLVTLETRESGHSGICRSNGELRYGLIEEILTSGIDVGHLLFEAPSVELQSYFVRRIGPNVNLGNIATDDAISLETIRLGLRSDTLLAFEPNAVLWLHESA
ncbi:MAG: phosphosulfolactate synthase [Acidimicrobiales bacterium]